MYGGAASTRLAGFAAYMLSIPANAQDDLGFKPIADADKTPAGFKAWLQIIAWPRNPTRFDYPAVWDGFKSIPADGYSPGGSNGQMPPSQSSGPSSQPLPPLPVTDGGSPSRPDCTGTVTTSTQVVCNGSRGRQACVTSTAMVCAPHSKDNRGL
jgi:hypothetical protein